MLWGFGLVASGVAAVLGGTYHAVGPGGGAMLQAVLWKGVLICIGVMDACMLWAAIRASCRGLVRTGLIAFVALKFVAYAVWMAGHDAYRFVLLETGLSMLLLVALQVVNLVRGFDVGAGFILGGVVVAAGAALVQRSAWGLGWFNHNDLYHLIQMPSVWLFYRGGLRLRDRV